jgi:hypothetical protein
VLDSPRSLSILRLMMRTSAHGDPTSETLDGKRPIELARCRIRDEAQRSAASFTSYLDAQVARGTVRPVDTTLAGWIFVQGTIMTMVRRKNGDPSLASLTRDELVDRLIALLSHGVLPW